MKNDAYWKRRFRQLEKAQNAAAISSTNYLQKQYALAQKEIEAQIASWYQRFATNNQITMQEARKMLTTKQLAEFKWDVFEYIKHGEENALTGQWMKELENASARFHVSRLEALKLQTQQVVESLYGKQTAEITKLLKHTYLEGYYQTAYEIQKGFNLGWNISAINEPELEKILSKPWSTTATNFSTRIWDSKAKLISELQAQLTQGLVLGKAPDDAIQAIAKRFDVSKNQAARLVMTESAYFSNQSQKDCFNALDVEQFEIVATLDSTTCSICGAFDGHVDQMANFQAGVTAPPFHPWCRCTTVPYFADNAGERFSRDADGNAVMIPANVTYADWQKSFVVEPQLAKEKYDLLEKMKGLEDTAYTDIWKDNVTVKDYASKKGSIPAKRTYFEGKVINASTVDEANKFKDLIHDLDTFEANGKSYTDMQTRVKEIDKELKSLNNGGIMADDPYTQDRKDAAYWFKDKQDADAVLRPHTGEVWQGMNQTQKRAAYEYTGGSGKFNRPLRGYDGSWYSFKGVGNVPLDNEGAEKYIRALQDALKDSTYDFDIWLQRGVETTSGAASFLGITESQLTNSSLDDLRQLLVGSTITDEAFVSTAGAKGAGFSGYIFNVYAPKGTQMIYAEPFSAFGHGSELSWDGVASQSSFGYEFEVILNSGYDFRVLKVDKSGGNYYFDIEVLLPP